jgi:hypothetical protein
MCNKFRAKDMAYELFKRTVARVETPTVSIAPDGRVAINVAVVRLFKDAGISSVVFLWDEKNRRMAIKAARKNDRNAFAVSFSKGHSGIIRAKSFLSHIRWSAARRERLDAIWNEKDEMIEVTLPAAHIGKQAPNNSE